MEAAAPAGGPPGEATAWPDQEDAIDLDLDLDLDPALALVPPPAAAIPEAAAGSAWRRIPLGPDAELLVREEVYRRRRDRIDWLLGWARKVFD
jgi:hypothetical protein